MFSIHTLRKSVSFEPARSAFCHKFFPAIPVSCLIPNSKESSVGVYTELLKIYHTLVKYVGVFFSFLDQSDSRGLKLREELFIFLQCYNLTNKKPFLKSQCIQLEIRVRNESVSRPEFGKTN